MYVLIAMYCYVTYLDDIDEAHIAYSLDNILLVAKRDDIHCFLLYVRTLLHFRVRSNFTIHRWPLQFISWKSNGQNVENIYKKFVASYMLKVKDGVANPFIPNIFTTLCWSSNQILHVVRKRFPSNSFEVNFYLC